MDTTTSTTTQPTSRTTSGQPAGRPARQRVRPVARAHDVAVQVGVWGPQDVGVRASSGGGRDGKPYIAVTVGECLTYVYDRAGLGSYLAAWREADRLNRCSVRLPEFAPLREQQEAFAAGQDFAAVCNVTREQHTAVHAHTGQTGRPVITVVVGAVTTRVHTTTALACYLDAWTRAETVRNILEPER